MKDCVYCAECGIMIDSDFAVTSKNNENSTLFFCSEKHKQQWHRRDNSYKKGFLTKVFK